MQKVSKEYKASMKSSLRERAFIMLSFGLVNQELQAKAKVNDGAFTYYSDKSNLLGEHGDDTVYATLEENFTKVDGSMFFLPRKNSATKFYDTGIVSDKLISEAKCELTISLNTIATDFKGLSINFGENYPVDFDMIGSTGQIVQFRNNDKAEWSTEEVFTDTTYIKLIFYRMKNPQSRLRIYRIKFGYGLVYHNDSIIDSRLDNYVSPIGADVPQIDFSVQLKNYDHYFNVDNPKSAINYLETGQEMDIMYGYQLPSGEVEWVQGNHLLCSEWESDDNTATIRCQDIFRNMDSEYVKGIYSAEGKSYYQLAEEILKDAGVKKYYIDPRLKHLFSQNPIPRVKHKEALQIIANACRCSLSQTRYGDVEIKSSFVPLATVGANNQTSYSHAENIFKDSHKDEYASLSPDYTRVDGGMYFLPKNGVASRNTGYVSQSQSDNNGKFAINPILTITFEAVRAYYGMKFVFGESLPAEFIIRTYNDGKLSQTFIIKQSEIEKVTWLTENYNDLDKIEVEFTKTVKPNSRIVLNHFELSDTVDFTMSRSDMITSPKAIKQELVKDVIVPCYSYQKGNREENLVNEEVTVVAGQKVTYYIQDASYGYRVLLNEQAGQADVIDWGNYYVTIRYKVSGSFRLEVQGYRYKIVEKYAVKSLHARGKTIKWENPLISDMEMATDLSNWLGDYYKAGIEYEYDTRGNPELDATDIIYQENEFQKDMKVNIYRHTIIFKQSFAGKVTARRIGG